MLVTTFRNAQFTNIDDMALAMQQNQELQQAVKANIKRFHHISVSETMNGLSCVGDLLTLAYAGCKGFSSAPLALGLLSDFQTLTYECIEACNTFINGSIESLSKHRFAILFSEKNNIKKALEKIGETAQLASEMVQVSDRLVTRSGSLCDKSQEALLATCNDQNCTEAERRKIHQMIGDYKARKEALDVKSKDLDDSIDELRDEEVELAKDAKKAKTSAFILSFFPFSTARNMQVQEAQSLDAKEVKVKARRMDYQKELRETNAQLAESISRLANTKSEENDLEKSIHSLDVSIKTLGKIKTTFEEVRAYWQG